MCNNTVNVEIVKIIFKDDYNKTISVCANKKLGCRWQTARRV